MAVPTGRKYAQTHEWFEVSEQTVRIGITQFAADELSDITFVELPEVGKEISAGSSIGEIESVKATSELYSAIGGQVSAVNEQLTDSPELVNNDPYEGGWMLKVDATDLSGLDNLMDAEAYEKMIAE